MDSTDTGIFYSDLMGEFDININDPVTFSTLIVDSISENTPNNTVAFGNTITSHDIIPDVTNTRNLGSVTKKYANEYVTNLFADTTTQNRINLTDVTNQITMGAIKTVTLNAPTPFLGSSTMTIPDVGSSDFVMTSGIQAIGGVKAFTSNLLGVSVSFSSATDSSSTSTGSIITTGGIGVAKTITTTNLTSTNSIIAPGMTNSSNLLFIAPNGNFNFFSTSNSNPVYLQLATNGVGDAVIGIASVSNQWVSGSVTRDLCLQAFSGNQIVFGDNLNPYARMSTSVVTIPSNTSSNSSVTGCLVCAGGVGIGRNLHCAGLIFADSGSLSTSQTTGSIIVSGGIGCNNESYLNTIRLNTAGGTPSALNYYEEVAYTPATAGAWVATHPVVSCQLCRIGAQVTMRFGGVTSLSSSASSILFTTSLPANYWPAIQLDMPINVFNSGLWQMGVLRITAAGVITIYSTLATSAFANGVTIGFDSSCITWLII